MQNKFLSIIIPVYNVEKFVEKCVESILVNLKKYESEYEILLVDDGSKDKSGEVCDKLASQNQNIKVFHKQNGGASTARNFGIEKAEGEFIMFIDSDDYVDENILKAYDQIKQNRDLCEVFEFNLIFHKRDKIEFLSTKKQIASISNFKDCKKIMFPTTKRNSLIIKVVKTNFIKQNNLFFKVGTLEEDYNLTPKIWLKAKNIFLSDIRFYHYIMYREGSTTSMLKKKYFLDLIESSVENFENAKQSKLNSKTKKLIYQYLCFNVLAILRKLKTLSEAEQLEVLENINKHKYLLKYPSTFKTKIFMIFARIFGLKNALKFA